MITDDPQEMERRLTHHVKHAREALETLYEIGSPDAPAEQERFIAALHKLTMARAWLRMASEQLQQQWNDYQAILIDVQQDIPDE